MWLDWVWFRVSQVELIATVAATSPVVTRQRLHKSKWSCSLLASELTSLTTGQERKWSVGRQA